MPLKILTQLILVFLSIEMLVSCRETINHQKNMQALIERWQGKEIILPDTLIDVLTGDTLDIASSDFIMLTYVDSSGCAECKMKLPMLKDFINMIDTVSDASFQPLIVIHPRDEMELKYLLKRNGYFFPVTIDENDSIERANSFPEENIFRTFLLNSNRQVIAIGNPILNNKIRNLYKSIVSGQKIYNYDGSSSVKAINPIHDFGTLLQGQKVNCDFKIINNSSENVKIDRIVTSCDCTTCSVSDSVIAPGEKHSVNVIFQDSITNGDFSRIIHVFYHGFEYPIQLEIIGKMDIMVNEKQSKQLL